MIRDNSFNSITSNFEEIKTSFGDIKNKIDYYKPSFAVFKKDRRRIILESVNPNIEREFKSKDESYNKIKSDLKDIEKKIQKDFDNREFQAVFVKSSKEATKNLLKELYSKYNDHLSTFENNISNEEKELKNFLPTKRLALMDEEKKRIETEDKFKKVIAKFEKIKTLLVDFHIKIRKLKDEIVKFSPNLRNELNRSTTVNPTIAQNNHNPRLLVQSYRGFTNPEVSYTNNPYNPPQYIPRVPTLPTYQPNRTNTNPPNANQPFQTAPKDWKISLCDCNLSKCCYVGGCLFIPCIPCYLQSKAVQNVLKYQELTACCCCV